jgi:DNA mismatch repair protein MutL
MIRVDAGRVAPVRPAAHGAGTRIEVEDLFHATPARLKFLKGDRAEAQAAALVVRRLAMAHPGIAFALAGDHLAGFDLAGESGPEAAARRVAAILGRDFGANAAPVLAERPGLRLEGLASVPTFHRASALDQYLFVNGRPVRDRLLIGALRAAYADTITAGRHPVVALFLTLDPAAVDVNVHPAKLEVRFRDGEAVRGLIVSGIRDALAAAGHRASSLGGAAMLRRFEGHGLRHLAPPPGTEAHAGGRPLSFVFPGGLPPAAGASGLAEPPVRPAAVPQPGEGAEFPLGHAVAQLHATYIVAQTARGIVIVDQHAAHERLVYERLKTARAAGPVPRQPLLIPAIVDLGEAGVARLAGAAEDLAGAGLVIEPFGPGAIAVQEVPAPLAGADIPALVRDLADQIAEWGGAEALAARIDHVLKTFACHHSVRAGRLLRREEMDALLREMEATPGSGQCNHGRPTYIEMDLGALERLFGRS